MTTRPGLRERKKERTREALTRAALELFEERGFEQTTVADIAAGADVSTRTFFSYFPTKEEVLFADTQERIALALEVIDNRRPEDRPVDLLLRAVARVFENADGANQLFSEMAPLRVRLITTAPMLQGVALQRMFAAQQQIGRHLHAAYPDELDQVSAAAMVGALVGALINATITIVSEAAEDASRSAGRDALIAELRRVSEIVVNGLAYREAGSRASGSVHRA